MIMGLCDSEHHTAETDTGAFFLVETLQTLAAAITKVSSAFLLQRCRPCACTLQELRREAYHPGKAPSN